MKKMYFAILALGLFAFTSCSEEQETTYNVDSKGTTLQWTGKYVKDGHTHTGKITVSEGNLTYKGEEFVKGSFTIDMASIVDEDLDGAMKDTLESHLNGAFFFNTGKYATAEVEITSMNDKEADATITVVGKKINAKIPLTVKKDEKTLTAKGKFEVDFASANLNGFKPMPGDPADQHTDSKIAFELNLKMKK